MVQELPFILLLAAAKSIFQQRWYGVNSRNGTKTALRNNSPAYIHICCEVIIWAKFGVLNIGYFLGQAKVIIWAKLILAYFYSGFKWIFAHSVIIWGFFGGGGNYQAIFKNSVFRTLGARTVFFFKFPCFELPFGKISFLRCQNTIKIWVATFVCVYLCSKTRERAKTMITGISGFGFLLSKHGRFVTHICFSKNGLLKPTFYSVLGARAFWVKLSKNVLDKARNNTIWLITEKLTLIFFFLVFFFLLFFCVVVFFSGGGGCFCFFGGFKGQRATSLGPKPSLFFWFAFLFFFWGGGGCFSVLFSFGFCFLFRRKTCLSLKWAFLLFFSVSLCFSLPCSPPPFHSLFLCLCPVVFFLSSFLPCLLSFLLSFASMFLSLCFFAFFGFVFLKRKQHQNIK